LLAYAVVLSFVTRDYAKEDNNMKSRSRRLLRRTALLAGFAALSSPATAAFFQIAESSPSGIGNAFAGGAASAEDASVVWYNPAGMTRLGQQLVVGGHLIDPSFKATVVSASAVTTVPISGGGGDPGQSAFVPNLYYARPITNSFSLGAGINAPFGLATEYDSTWAGRYHATRSEIKDLNANFSGAYKFNDVLSAGAGINYQQLNAELSQAVDFATICTALGASAVCGLAAGFNPNTNPNDGQAKVTADSNAWGYNLGILAQPTRDLRVGAAYRSKMKHSLSGDFDITTPGNAAAVAGAARLVNSGAKADITLPASWSLSAYQQLGSQWALMADITRTNWSALPELRIKFDSGQQDSVVTLNLKDVYRYSIGATYKPNTTWLIRMGVALDQSPTPDSTSRTPRLPDSDRTWLSLGAGFQASPAVNLDFAYTYIKMDASQVRKTATGENTFRGNLSADYTGSIQILSAQVRWMF
jgi:long-chain fatty acid transport protein